jgi:hypothetical protein
MTARRRIAAHGLALALALASVAEGQTGPSDPTRNARPLSWTNLFAAPPLRTPVSLIRVAVRGSLAAGAGGGRDSAAPRTVFVDARPPPPSTMDPGRGAAPAGDASVTVETPVRRAAIFFDVLGGTERRVRPVEETDRAFAVGSPLVALKFGVARRFRNDWEVAGSLGAAINLFTGEQHANGSSVFAEVEANRYLARGSFIGTGLSLWDLTRSNMWTPAWLLHFGIPLSRSARYAVFLIGEGRLFLARLGDVTGNYEIWGGVQMRLRR